MTITVTIDVVVGVGVIYAANIIAVIIDGYWLLFSSWFYKDQVNRVFTPIHEYVVRNG